MTSVAEWELAGDCLAKPEMIDYALTLPGEAFSDTSIGLIWDAMRGLRDASVPPSIATVRHWLRESGLGNDDVARQVPTLLDHAVAPNPDGVQVLANAVAQRHRARTLSTRLEDVARRIKADPHQDLNPLLEEVEESAGLTIQGGRRTIDTIDALSHEAARHLLGHAEYPSIKTGIASYDRIMGPMRVGGLYTVGGRTSNGKSSFCFNVARAICSAGGRVIIFSMEMGREEVADVLIKIESGIPKRTAPRDGEEEEVKQAAGRMETWKLAIDDKSQPSLSYVARIIERWRRVWGGVDLVVIDYVQLMGRTHSSDEQRHVTLGNITANLKAMARDKETTVMQAAQVNRQSLQRKDSRPTLADLRESGSIEQDSTAVVFTHNLHKIDPMLERDVQGHDSVELIVAKNRHGPTGIASMRLHGATQRFLEI